MNKNDIYNQCEDFFKLDEKYRHIESQVKNITKTERNKYYKQITPKLHADVKSILRKYGIRYAVWQDYFYNEMNIKWDDSIKMFFSSPKVNHLRGTMLATFITIFELSRRDKIEEE